MANRILWARSSARPERRTLNLKRSLNWAEFREYLLNVRSKKHTKDVVNYARKYSHCLLNEDFSDLCGFSAAKRRHVLAALSNLSKFLGRYDVFQRLMKEYGLKWESAKAADLLISRITKTSENGKVIEWLLEVKTRFPDFSLFMDFILVSGLRLVEAINSYNLIIDLAKKGRLSDYYSAEEEILEHFRFKRIFIRNNKKVFVSFIPKLLVEKIINKDELTISQIYNCIKRRGFKPRFADVREYFATYMAKYLTQPEIDFLQGRISGSVFMRNYFNPALIGDLKERVFKGITSLKCPG